ncbi:MAG: hypothetical protein RL675_469 [Bacteroidota bacterium]
MRHLTNCLEHIKYNSPATIPITIEAHDSTTAHPAEMQIEQTFVREEQERMV